MPRKKNNAETPVQEIKKSKFQKYEVETINRKDIKNAPYNPRIIDDATKKRLKKGIQKHGLVSAITWNRRTGNICGGHQRLEQLDSLEKNQNYSLDVCVIDVDEQEEAIINVQLNNPSLQGEWDYDKLADLKDQFNIDFVEDMGFTPLDVDVMFDGLFSDYYETPEREEVTDKIDKIKEARAHSKEIYKDNAALNYYTVIVFGSEEEKRLFMEKISVPFSEQFITEEQIMRLSKK